jgi:hypothetical protein
MEANAGLPPSEKREIKNLYYQEEHQMKKYITLFTTVCMLLMCFSGVITLSQETQDFSSYTPIASAEDFALIQSNPSGNYAVTQDITVPVTAMITGDFTGKLVGTNADRTAEEMRIISVSITGTDNKVGIGLFSALNTGAEIRNITLNGSVKFTGTGSSTMPGIGGFAGEIKTGATNISVSNCVNKASIDGPIRVGGFLGRVNSNGANIVLSGLRNEGAVTAVHVSNYSNVGGIIGYATTMAVPVTNCGNTGEVTGSTAAGARAGGIVGWSYASVNNCYNTGKIKIKNFAGGIVGVAANSAKITNCFNTGTVNATGGQAAGIVADSHTSKKSTVSCTYNAGTVTGSTKGNPIYITALASASNNYYLSESAEDDGLVGTEPLTDAQLKAQSALEGFDFNSVWIFDTTNPNFSYPQLRSNRLPLDVEEPTPQGPILISSAEEFLEIKSNGEYRLTQDITLPVNSSIKSIFTGSLTGYDAAGETEEMRTIALSIDTQEPDAAGLFSTLGENAALKNLTITGSVNAPKASKVGAFAGEIFPNGTTVALENCVNHASVTGSEFVGGIVGRAYNSVTGMSLKNLKNHGVITATLTSNSNVGGLFGLLGTITGSAENLVNTGNVVGKGSHAGGLCGWSYARIRSSFNTGNVTGMSDVGGLVGLASGKQNELISCYNAGRVTAFAGSAGGIAGNISTSPVIENTYALCSVYGEIRNPFGVLGSGGNGNAIKNSYYQSFTAEDDGVAGTTAKTLDEIKTLSSLLGADFVAPTADYSYPDLKNNPNTYGTELFTLSIEKTGNGMVVNEGSHIVPKNNQLELSILPDNGYYMEQLSFNAVPVMGNEVADYTYLTPPITQNSTVSVRFAFNEEGLPQMLSSASGFFSGTDTFLVGNQTVTAPVGIVFSGIKATYGEYQRTDYGILLSETTMTPSEFVANNKNVIKLPGKKAPNAYGHFGIRFYGDNIQTGKTYYTRPYAVFSNGSSSKTIYGDILERTIGQSNNAPVLEKNSLKVLAIGNSFSRNAQQYLPDIAKAGNVNLTVANLYIGGASLEQHAANASSNTAAYTFYLNGQAAPEKYSILQALESDNWDVVTFQQGSLTSVDYATYQPYLQSLSDYVKLHEPNAEQVIHQTWAYHPKLNRVSDPTHASYMGMDAEGMFQNLKTAYSKAAASLSAKIIPTGEAFHIAQSIDPTIMLHDTDYYHANSFGCYLAGAVWYEVLTGHRIEDNNFRPEGMSDTVWKILKASAHQAAEAYRK